MLDDTVAAISTPLGEGGLAVVRLSGAHAFKVADGMFTPIGKSSATPSTAATHTVHYGHVRFGGKVIDEVMLTVFRAPRTFTREDMVEISCHGGILPAKLVLDAALAGGARLATPGEFTKRAFLNGRIDLAQAEAVADLIHSKTELALAAANEQLAGKLSKQIEQVRDDLVQTLAHVEAHIDFPDEDIAPDTKQKLLQRLERASEFMAGLLRTATEGQILRRGIRAAIVGRPNAGKSSLLNLLLGHERAIVSPIPGTTRDTIEETANIRGIPVIFVDTAGLRESADSIEQEGIRRSRRSVDSAELILLVVDGSEATTPDDNLFLAEFSNKKCLLVINKSDLPRSVNLTSDTGMRGIEISCATGKGLAELKDGIERIVWGGTLKTDMSQVAINSRHQEALARGKRHTDEARESLRGEGTLEIVAMDLRIAMNAVGEIVGKTSTEDLLDSIFSQFCLGK